MISLEKVRLQLERLGLTQAAAVLDARLQVAAQREMAYAGSLVGLLGAETVVRRERCLRTRPAHLP